MYIINESYRVNNINHPFNSDFEGLMFKDIKQRDLKSLEKILDRNDITYDVVKDLNYYQVITDLDKNEIEDFIKLAKELETKTGHKTYDYFMNR